MQGGVLVNIEKKKSFLLWGALLFGGLFSISMLTSLGQILSQKDSADPELLARVISADSSAFNPAARAKTLFRSFEFSQGAHIIYDGNAIAGRNFFDSDEAESAWWISSDSAIPEMEAVRESAGETSSLKNGNPVPRLWAGDFDPQARAKEFVSMGVADLLNLLRDKDLKRSYDKDAKSNPFEEALKNSSGESAGDEKSAESTGDKTKSSSNGDSSNQDQQGSTDASSGEGTPAQTANPFLIVGGFGDQLLTVASGTSQELLYPVNNSGAVLDIAGAGIQTFDLKMLLRNSDSRESIAFGDLNSDGFPDLVVTNRATNKAYIYINDGQGNYVITSEIYGGLSPAAATIADFGGEGSPDIAVIIQTGKRIVVDGKGLRKFIFFPTSEIDKPYSSLLPCDFDGNGINDLLLTDYGDHTVSMYLNQGDGTFVHSGSYPIESIPYLQAKADLNGDGIEDSVFVQHVGNQVAIVMVNGADNSVSSLANTTYDPSVYYVLGDFNQDGVADIAIARRR